MTPETFRGPELRSVLEAVRRAYGDDAVILSTHSAGGACEVIAMRAQPAASQPIAAATRADRPYLIALVGPAGAGKSTAAARLAHQLRNDGSRVALLTLDTFRIGALEQMQLFAELLDLPLDVLYDAGGLDAVRSRMRAFDTVIIDTPGRRSGRGDAAWSPLLAALSPDEVHLVLHAGMRPDVAAGMWRAWATLAPGYLLPTHIDELSSSADLATLLTALRQPARWLGTGPELGAPLTPAHMPTNSPATTPVPEHAAALEALLRARTVV
jgi:flagellar biosynthesis protein FlhF